MPAVSPQRIFETLEAFRRTAALRAAIELDIFTAIAEGTNTTAMLAKRCSASERGLGILASYLVMIGFLQKHGETYSLAADAAAFLDRRSFACLGAAAAEALSGKALVAAFATLTEAVRHGGTTLQGGGTLAPEHPVWVEFARAMRVPGAFLAHLLGECLDKEAKRPSKVLDIAAGHGLYGIEFAKRNPDAEVFAVDWPEVLAIARGNADIAGVGPRFHSIPGDALTVDFGTGYDLALITNFLPDLDSTTAKLKRIHSVLVKDGRVAAFELMLDDDRTSPPAAVSLNLTLLATTPGGEARTPSQLAKSLESAGFGRVELRELPPAPNRVMIAHR
jgi:O-methyltransferase domain/Dimerisation domain